MANWWGGFKRKKKEEEPKIDFYEPNSELQNKSNERRSTEQNMAKQEEFDEDDFEDEETEEEQDDVDLDEEEERDLKSAKKLVTPVKPVGRPSSQTKAKPNPIKAPVAEEEDVIAVVDQLPTQQIVRAMVEGKPTKFETVAEALTNLRNDIAAIRKAVGA